MKNTFLVFIACVLTMLMSASAFCTDKYAQGPIDWNSGTWYDAASGGSATTKPVAGDNAFTNGFVVTVSTDETCDNLTLTNLANAITVSSGKTLTVRGLLNCTATPSVAIVGGLGTIKLTGAAFSSPAQVIGSNWAAAAIFYNLTFDPGSGIELTTGANIEADAGTIEIASGTVTLGSAFEIRGTGTAVLQIDAGASLNSSGQIRGSSSGSSYFPTVTINGIVATTSYLNATTITIGSNGTLNTAFAGTQGWWNAANAPTTMNIGGTVNYNLSGAQSVAGATYNNLTVSGSGTKTLSGSATVSGTLTLTSGTVTTGANTLTLNGSINQTTGNIDASNASASVMFSGSSVQSIPASMFTGLIKNITFSNNVGVTLNSSLTVNGTCTVNGVLNCGTNTIGGSGSTKVNPPATVNIGHADGLAGNIFTLGSNSFSPGATYVYNGLVAQAISSYLPDNLTGKLKIDNSNGVSLNRSLTITSGTLDLNSGILKTRFDVSTIQNLSIGSTATISNYSSNSFVNGPLIATLSSGVDRTFPIGSGTTYRPMTLHMNVGQDVTAEMFNTVPSGPFTGSGVDKISLVRYYSISNANSSNCTITLPWGIDDGINDLTNITAVFGANSSIWVSNNRSGGTTGNASSGTVRGTFSNIVGADFTLGNITGGTNPLPVEMTFFTAVAQKVSAVLAWSTATEVNNYGFEIERRTIAGIAWAKVGFMAGNGTTNSTHEYSYTDNNLSAGKYAYRIKQIDNSGAFKYSKSTELEIAASASFALNQNYPNPFNPTTNFTYGVAQTEFVSVKIFDVLGREVTTLVNEIMDAGTHSISFDAHNLPSGVYYARLQSGTQTATRQIILMK